MERLNLSSSNYQVIKETFSQKKKLSKKLTLKLFGASHLIKASKLLLRWLIHHMGLGSAKSGLGYNFMVQI
jgi:hypothetical protein